MVPLCPSSAKHDYAGRCAAIFLMLGSRELPRLVKGRSLEATLFTDNMAKLGPRLGADASKIPPWKSGADHVNGPDNRARALMT